MSMTPNRLPSWTTSGPSISVLPNRSTSLSCYLLLLEPCIYWKPPGQLGQAIHSLLRIAADKETLIITLLILIFATLGTIGFGEGGIPFIPLAATVVMGMGYDRMTGFATAAGGLAVGFTAGAVNFYTTGVAQMITGLPLYSGLFFRLISFVVLVIITILYVVYFAKQVKNDPTKSVVAQEYIQQLADAKTTDAIEGEPFTTRRKIALLGRVVQLVVSVYGAINLGWAMAELSALYIIYAIFLVIVLKIKPNEAAANFGKGAMRLLPAALAIGFTRSVVVLMNQAKIVDTAVHALAQFLNNKPMIISLFVIYLAIIFFNFFVVSGDRKSVV